MFNKIVLVFFIMFNFSQAGMFQTVHEDDATLVQKGANKLYCPNCGMNLVKFHKTNHVHKHNQYCSMHCLVENNKDELPSGVKVIDAMNLKLIDASKASYVVGSKKKGTMTMNSKYAFSSEEDVEDFVFEHGGEVVSFKEAFEIAKDDFKQDMKMISKKRSKMVYKKGKNFFKAKCQQDKIDVNSFDKISSLKAYIRDNKLCGNKAKDKQLQMVSVYLWDIKKLGKKTLDINPILVPKKAKCPVCGMFVSKYPKWSAKIASMGHEYYFDGVKDMMKFIFEKNQDFKNIMVTDYYTTGAINARESFYVVGSNIYGPMGNELIPFSTMDKAKEFSKNHGGKQILTFKQITKELVYSLDK